MLKQVQLLRYSSENQINPKSFQTIKVIAIICMLYAEKPVKWNTAELYKAGFPGPEHRQSPLKRVYTDTESNLILMFN